MAKTYATRTCKQCGSSFPVKREWQKFCGLGCKKLHEKAEREEAYALLEARNKERDLPLTSS